MYMVTKSERQKAPNFVQAKEREITQWKYYNKYIYIKQPRIRFLNCPNSRCTQCKEIDRGHGWRNTIFSMTDLILVQVYTHAQQCQLIQSTQIRAS